MLEVRPDLPKQVCSLRPRRLPPVSPRLGPLAARSGSSEERGSPPGTEAAACRGAAEPLIPVPRLAAPIPRTALPRRPPQKERSPRRPPGPSSSSPASSPPSFLGVWLSLRPPLPSITDVLNQPKDLCQGWVCSDSFLRGRLGGGRQAPGGLEPAWTVHPPPQGCSSHAKTGLCRRRLSLPFPLEK